MKKLFFLIFCCIQSAQAQVISDTPILDWQKSGYKEFNESEVHIN